MADHCLRLFVILKAAAGDPAERESAWHFVVALFALPAIFLAPLNGALGNSLPKPKVLIGSAAFCLVVVLAFIPAQAWGHWCLALLAVGSAVYFPVRYAMLPAAAEDAHIPLTRVNGWMEMGAVASIVIGMILGGTLYEYPNVLPGLGGIPSAVFAALGLNFIGLVAALPVAFPSDVRRREAPGPALAGFFRDAGRILRQRDTRGSLLAWAGFRGLVAAVTGAFIAEVLSRAANGEELSPFRAMLTVAPWITLGVAVGCVLAGVQGHPRRSLGLVPFGLTGLVIAMIWAAITPVPGPVLCVVVGVLGGVVNIPLFSAYQDGLPADARGNGMAVMNTANSVFMTGMCFLMFALARLQILRAAGQVWLVAGLTGIGVFLGWRLLLRESLEQFLEILIWPIYRIKAHGPGKEHCPRHGPLLIVANHTAWFDPLWIAKVVPRRVTPMMTSVFYDLPVLRFLMVHVVQAIRVQSSGFRREAPELDDAVAALDRGECLVIFPEGMLRRREDLLLRNFGQGVWHILRKRPATPVVTCWIEGGWGSYMSYYKGPPLVNKRLDWWRHIEVAISEPQVLDSAALADDRTTRSLFMRACLNLRASLGLPPASEHEVQGGEQVLSATGAAERNLFERTPPAPRGETAK
jgi:1-acyl-sn-glycerol-3-phosphate acyltransferase